ncbi:unnamed protein product [Ixodes pacificus]
MLIYTLQHLVNVLLKRLLHSVLWQPTTLCFVFFLLCMSNAIPTQRQMHFHTPHMFYVHIVACICSLYQPFLHLPELRVVQVLLFRGAHYCTGQNMQPEQSKQIFEALQFNRTRTMRSIRPDLSWPQPSVISC